MANVYAKNSEKGDSDVKLEFDAEQGDSSPCKEAATIGAERSATFMSCMVNMAMTAMGLGVLGFGKSFAQMGFILGMSLTLVAGIFTHASMAFLIRCCNRTNTFSFEELSEYYLGWWGVRFTNWALIFQLFFVVAAFILIPVSSVTDMHFGDLCHIPPENKLGHTLLFRRLFGLGIIVFVSAVGFVGPLSKLSIGSTLSFFLLSGAVILFVVEFGSASEHATPNIGPGDKVLSGIGNTVLAYTCQFNFVTCHFEMKNRTRMHTLLYITIYGMCVPLYCFMGLTGMFVANIEERDNVFDALNDGSNVALAGKIMVCAMGILKTPLIFNAMRDYIIREARLLPCLRSLSTEKIIHRGVVSVLAGLLAWFTTWIFSDIGPPVNISGSLFMAPMNFIMPSLYIMKDVNIFGTASKSNNRMGFGWNRDFTPESRKLYILAATSVLFGAFCVVSGLTGVGFSLSADEEPAANKCGTS